MRLSSPYRSADGETMYANDEHGTRRRVAWDGPRLVLVTRVPKAEQKRRKRLHERLARELSEASHLEP